MVDSWVYQVGSQKNGWEASCTVFYLGQKFQVQFGSKQVGSGRVIKFFSVLPCLITPCWVGLVGLFGLFSYFSLDCAGHHQLGFILFLHFWAFQDPFYSSRRAILLCLVPVHHSSLKEGLWAHFGLYFLFSRDTFPSWSIVWAMFVCFLLFWAFEVRPNCFFFARALTHFLGQLGLFSSSGLWEWISKNGYQQRVKYSLHPQGLD